MDFGCIILAAGQGKRFGMEKMYYSWHNKMLWQNSYNLAKQFMSDVVVVGLDIDGGKTRQESVRSGLRLIDNERVIILEIARPLVSREDIHVIMDINYPSVTYAVKSEEAVWDSKSNMFLNPKTLSTVKNLQAFDTKLLKEAHNKTSLLDAPDDTCIMHEVHGIEPHLIEGKLSNLWKLTTEEDIGILDALCSSSKW